MKNCLFCKHFHFEAGMRGYSVWFPGSNWHMYCDMKIWDEDSLFDEDIRELLTHANTCGLYVIDDWALKRYGHLFGE